MHATTRKSLRLLAAASLFALSGVGPASAADIEWGYFGEIGPEFWGTLDPSFVTCGVGLSQSPIDIRRAREEDDLTEIVFDYHETPLTVVNNGHTIEVEYEPGSSITVNGKTFGLAQFHFHSPSEHELRGRLLPLEGHLVHSRAAGEGVELAVVGVLFEEGAFNPFFERIMEAVRANGLDLGEGEVTVAGEEVNAVELLPRNRTYYAYSGSLTTPPCTEGVNWHVLKRRLEISADQAAEFAAIFDGLNARPVQPLNGRRILRSEND